MRRRLSYRATARVRATCRLSGWAAVLVLQVATAAVAQPTDSSTVRAPGSTALWYRRPAASWNEALPVGNGRLGAMLFGGVEREHLQLNEETLWTGGPYDPVVPGAGAALPEVRRLLFAGDIVGAHDLFGRRMMGVPYEQMKYQPLGDLLLTFPGHADATDYRRELDLDEAIARVRYRSGGVTYTREVFISAVAQVLVVQLTADRPGALSVAAELRGARNPAHSNYGTDYFQMDGVPPASLVLTGKNSDYLGVPARLRHETRLVARASGGTVRVEHRTLRVSGADTVTLLLAAATNFVDYRDVSADPAERVRAALAGASARSYADLRRAHVDEHRGWFRRVRLALGGTPDSVRALPTDERIQRLATVPDPDLAALYYQFGRYLLIASSRPGTQAANLQGIWNDNPNPWWDSKYTVNINLPMNYWPAESGALGELVQPLERLVRDVAAAGTATAREHWGARGWVLHQNTDLWRSTTPMDGPSWGAWPVGGAWLMTQLYERFRYTADVAELQALYPLLREQVRFLLDILVAHPQRQWLVTAPSNSPENFPAWPGNGPYFDEVSGIELQARTMTAGPTMDMQIIREVLREFVEANARLTMPPPGAPPATGTVTVSANSLRADSALVAAARAAIPRLAPNQVGKHGQLQEWLDDWDELEPQHRHLSPLWGLYPGSEITPDGTPALAAAAAVTLDRRGTGGCGWSYAWKMGLRARLTQGDSAWAQFRALLSRSSLPTLLSLCGRAMQVDGNFGATAAIAEMLVQSHGEVLRLLPALPADWREGKVEGLRGRGGISVDVAWKDGELTGATISSRVARTVVLRTGGRVHVLVRGKRIGVRQAATGTASFAMAPGVVYDVRPVE